MFRRSKIILWPVLILKVNETLGMFFRVFKKVIFRIEFNKI
ncbi:hypothetical protein LEP1GSC103_1698 [Leptospira borgpetersenii serovar Javanica str. UI 09931]|uniref:Uncharacterized protein n=5 Tax=Leptospira borgpetersenii TaxID=174 RepID=M3GRV2_LEPBO|nr:hypothetical protein LBBP_01486 [Leptospira borgpetersenii serovar Ballum]EKP12110.1 hypothetical protein LEP1GSC128_0172 [Leptospira borgpetersenii str. 200801926]EKQ90893.1 hypothetical protein LEP1GSC101_1283 [Leptospira borgpetersenii str. UI 09149]EKR00643.1 hypothetical protein LEP1GSC121_1278 [Leptospira borgpetersenii serovar Castellonis str. 200801910]EMF97533.1 hypothetical protein LEP1GSC123_1589 [Leptospira borgpetersenii str. 200701203]EMK09589.1 hypothetical protein LEP1GSC066